MDATKLLDCASTWAKINNCINWLHLSNLFNDAYLGYQAKTVFYFQTSDSRNTKNCYVYEQKTGRISPHVSIAAQFSALFQWTTWPLQQVINMLINYSGLSTTITNYCFIEHAKFLISVLLSCCTTWSKIFKCNNLGLN